MTSAESTQQITPVKPLDVPTAILKRRSIKTFESTPVSAAILNELLTLTVAAPSSYNLQDWRIILIQDETQKAAIAEACFGQQQPIQAPMTVVFAADPNAWKKDLSPIYEQGLAKGVWTPETVEYFKSAIPKFQASLGTKTREYCVKDAMIAATHFVLAAESLGLSTCFMNGWSEEKVKEVIGVSDDPDLAIAVIVPLGYATELRGNPGRLPFEHNVFVDTMDNPYRG
ncbi:nitroreductase family protein [filamentous cyanobacterium LEGE 11480]|uniref:Nitroreductase family protein n=1 Tax=Romeriopsis navalis LEGE 11480 TaxID=2777977 RepID=A0A928VW10_9CYAN|nr:nitroreductase family protein [Romeriopsis navalis]MBE9033532.1 nitroreductase family protein [Romeriopsis navalis LEGE 11480]